MLVNFFNNWQPYKRKINVFFNLQNEIAIKNRSNVHFGGGMLTPDEEYTKSEAS
jgi:hypothetical protein